MPKVTQQASSRAGAGIQASWSQADAQHIRAHASLVGNVCMCLNPSNRKDHLDGYLHLFPCHLIQGPQWLYVSVMSSFLY